MGKPASAVEQENGKALDEPVLFDIPAQPLAGALEAYGAATGLAMFYDAALASGHRSAPVQGLYPPLLGLAALLRGSGYVPRMTGTHSVSITPRPATAAGRPSAPQDSNLHRYEPYFSVLQARLGQALCDSDRAGLGAGTILFRFWLATSGEIARAEIIDSGGDPVQDKAIVAGIQGLRIDEPPPVNLPQPLTMAVFPPLRGETPGCSVPRHDRSAGQQR